MCDPGGINTIMQFFFSFSGVSQLFIFGILALFWQVPTIVVVLCQTSNEAVKVEGVGIGAWCHHVDELLRLHLYATNTMCHTWCRWDPPMRERLGTPQVHITPTHDATTSLFLKEEEEGGCGDDHDQFCSSRARESHQTKASSHTLVRLPFSSSSIQS
jgi:hypothetical protein